MDESNRGSKVKFVGLRTLHGKHGRNARRNDSLEDFQIFLHVNSEYSRWHK
jgi:hypothetical protein